MEPSPAEAAALGLAHHERDEPGPAVRSLDAALTHPEALGDFDLTWLRLLLGIDRLRVGRYEGAADLLTGVAEDIDVEPAMRSTALRGLSVLTWRLTADLGHATELLERAVIVEDRPPGEGMWWHDAAYRGQYLLDAARPGEAVKVLRHGVHAQRAETCADPATAPEPARADLAMALGVLAQAEVATDEVDAAVDHIEEAAELLPHRLRYGLAYQLIALGEVSAARGDHPMAVLALDEAESVSMDLELLPALVWVHRARGHTEWDHGDKVRAQVELERAFRLAEALGHTAEVPALRSDLDRL
jgi:tetratricopeptide (TPR) repeat protein